MASTLTAYIPNSKITTVTTSGGFIDTTSYLTRIDATDPTVDATFTLGSGFIIGQLKKIRLIVNMVDPGPPQVFFTVTVSGQHFLDGPLQAIVFTFAGDTAELMWTRNGWRIISLSSQLGTDLTPTIS
jgi:hypothetical protein